MKVWKIVFVWLLLSAINLHAQEDSDIFKKCEITYDDGKVLTGYIAFFLEISPKDTEDIYINSVESVLNLNDNNFEFKASLGDTRKSMSQKDIKKITIDYGNNNIITYKLMEIKKLNENGTISTGSSKKAWLPIVKEDVVSLYQKNIYSEKNRYIIKENDFNPKKTKKLITVTYLSNEKQNVAFEIYNLQKKRFLRKNLGDEYLAKVLQYVFQDCPTFVSKIVKNSKWNYKAFTDSDDVFDNQIKEIKNSDLDDFQKFIKIDTLDFAKEAQPFIKLIEEYKTNCN